MENNKRKPQITVEFAPEIKEELETISAQTHIPVTQICRQGTLKEMAELKRTHPLLADKHVEAPAAV